MLTSTIRCMWVLWAAAIAVAESARATEKGLPTAVSGQTYLQRPAELGCATRQRPKYGYWRLEVGLPAGVEENIQFNCTVQTSISQKPGSCENRRWGVALFKGSGMSEPQTLHMPIQLPEVTYGNWRCSVHKVPDQRGATGGADSEELGEVSMFRGEFKKTVKTSFGEVYLYGHFSAHSLATDKPELVRLADKEDLGCDANRESKGSWDVQMKLPENTEAWVRIECTLASYKLCLNKMWAESVFQGQGNRWVKAASIPIPVPKEGWATWTCTAYAGPPDAEYAAPEERLGQVYYGSRSSSSVSGDSAKYGRWTLYAAFSSR